MFLSNLPASPRVSPQPVGDSGPEVFDHSPLSLAGRTPEQWNDLGADESDMVAWLRNAPFSTDPVAVQRGPMPLDASPEVVPGPHDRPRLLETLGYNAWQISRIGPETRPLVCQHHMALRAHEFTHNDICAISRQPQCLEFLAQHCGALHDCVPTLSNTDLVTVADKADGYRALVALLANAQGLKEGPLQLQDEQLLKIAKEGKDLALIALRELGAHLTGELGLSTTQVVEIAGNPGGAKALRTVNNLMRTLRGKPYELSTEKVVAIARNQGGAAALEAVKALMLTLRGEPYKLSTDQVVTLASNHRGASVLAAVKNLMPDLLEKPYELSIDQVVLIANNPGGAAALAAVKELMPDLLKKPYELSINRVVDMASRYRGAELLYAFHRDNRGARVRA